MSNKVKPKDLPKIWSSPDNSRLMPNQISIRLPVHVAAKLYALEEVFPNKNRTEIIADLLNCAIDDVAESLPYDGIGEPIGKDDEGELYYESYTGLGFDYFKFLQRKKEDLEKELVSVSKKKTRKKS